MKKIMTVIWCIITFATFCFTAFVIKDDESTKNTLAVCFLLLCLEGLTIASLVENETL